MLSKSHFLSTLCAVAWLTAAQASFADVKHGVEAWSLGQYDVAVKQWRDLALKGDADAQFNLGQAYKMGRGVKTDLTVALDWYKKAAAQGHLQAADSYGHLLHYMGKVPESLPYLQASADRGDPRAQYLLGTELFNGVHIEKDWVRAYALMTRASSAGMGPASRSLAQMDQFVPIEQRQQATALAGELEQRAERARASQIVSASVESRPPAKSTKPFIVSPSKKPTATTPGFPPDIPVTTANEIKIADSKPKDAPAKKAPAKVAAVVDGAWRIQLGAFGDEANARKLWNSLEKKFTQLAALELYLKAAGNVTRLQAGPFGSRSAADAVCKKIRPSGQACISVPR